jgi:hypothetical protein
MFERHEYFMKKLELQGVRYVRVMPEYDDPSSAIGRGWRSTFQCSSRGHFLVPCPLRAMPPTCRSSLEEAERAVAAIGSECEWLSNGDLKTITAVLPAIREDRGEGRSQLQTFFNSIVAAYTGKELVASTVTLFIVIIRLERQSQRRHARCGDRRRRASRPCRDSGQVRVADWMEGWTKMDVQSAQEIMDEVKVLIPWEQGDVMLLDNRLVMHARQPFTGSRRILASLVRHPER